MPAEIKAFYDFGKFRCNPGEQLLLCEGKPVPLPPKTFEILVALIQNSGRLVTKEQLMRMVWPDSFVEEANLSVNISALRRVLGETPDGQQFIETVPKRGYRFIAPVTQNLAAAAAVPAVQVPSLQQEDELPLVPPAPSRSRRLPHWWLAAAGLALIAIIVSAVMIFRRPAKLSEKDRVVLAEFANTTGDPVFDDALRQGLSSQLEQSPYLNLLSDDRIAQTLALMAKPKGTRLTQELAREVCQRTASAAALNGTVTQIGTQYLLTLKAINCSNGESLGSTQAQAIDKNHVLEALGKLASEIRNQLGESLASVQKYDVPPENVTTPSLDALKAYSLGRHAMEENSDYATAVPLFQRAIGLDPNFAMAYARLGTSYVDLNETALGAEAARRAYELKTRVSERENFYITEHYELLVTGNLDAARKVDELSAEAYPHDTSYTNLGIIYSELGEYEKAVAAFERALSLNPETGNRYANLLSGYVQVNRPDKAIAAAQEAQRRHIDYPDVHVNLYWAAFLQRDTVGMEREATAVMGKPGHEDQMLNNQADTALYFGQLNKSRTLTQRAVEAAQKAEEKEAPALYLADAGVREALVGNNDAASKQARAALAISRSRDSEGLSAIALALAGDSQRATQLADDLGKRFPYDTIVQSNYLPTIHAAILLVAHDHDRAREALAAATPHELGGNIETLNFVLYPIYVRGQAYLAARQGPAAATEFQKIIDHPGVVRSEPIGALARLQLGRAFALTGDQARATAAYREFLVFWKDADSDLPLLKQAKAEYSKLR